VDGEADEQGDGVREEEGGRGTKEREQGQEGEGSRGRGNGGKWEGAEGGQVPYVRQDRMRERARTSESGEGGAGG
jgi:hypothetical protein